MSANGIKCGCSAAATSWCVECVEFICGVCVDAHKRIKMTSKHHITQINQESVRCSCEGAATSWCVECVEFICDVCVDAHKRIKMTSHHNITQIGQKSDGDERIADKADNQPDEKFLENDTTVESLVSFFDVQKTPGQPGKPSKSSGVGRHNQMITDNEDIHINNSNNLKMPELTPKGRHNFDLEEKKGIFKGSAKKELTILMLGETGVGKSTFINALVNYLLFENISDAAKNLQCVIPTSFAVYDESTDNMKECSFGDPDSNEADDKTQSSTQSCRCYNFQIGELSLKIIDTPGIADSRGVDRDILNLKHLLNFLSNYKELNAICILLKPNNAKVGVVFKYCVLELLTHLNKSACQNILFLFTNSRGTFYKPGDTAKPLRKVLEDIRSKPPNVEIKFDQDTYFCFDSESFRYLVAVSKPNNVTFDSEAQADFAKSWQRSVKECQRLFQCISGLKPHLVQDTISINNIKTKIFNLRKPIALITETISKEIALCEGHEKKIREFTGDIKELEKELYTPSLDIISEPLDKPITVCSDPRCCEKKSFNNTSKVHYKSICHKPCYLENSDDNIVGNSGLLDCAAFNKYSESGNEGWFDSFGNQ